MRVSIVLPCRNEARYIAACLDSILASDYPPDQLEVLVVDGSSEDGTREVVRRYAAAHSCVQLLENPRRVVPAGLNCGIRAATGEVIVRMDAHVVYPPDYVPRLVAALVETGADNVGGRVVTLPTGEEPLQRAIAVALSHPFGVGNSYFRIGSSGTRWVDTVPFGCFRRELFERMGLFDEELVRNQDDEFNHRLILRGGRVLLLPSVVSYYYARDSLGKLARMYYQYGYFKPLAARKLGRVMTLRQLVPPAFLVALAGLLPAALVWPPAALAWAVVAGSYVLVVAACCFAAVRRHGLRCAIALGAAFPALHLSYGFGFLRGLWDLARRRGAPRRDLMAVPLSR